VNKDLVRQSTALLACGATPLSLALYLAGSKTPRVTQGIASASEEPLGVMKAPGEAPETRNQKPGTKRLTGGEN